MVKPDSSIDYYAALDLNANATNTEIKKQYRKLGTYINKHELPLITELLQHYCIIPTGIPIR